MTDHQPDETERDVGVGPHPEPWPTEPRFDPALLAAGDRRNVLDCYRYWRTEAIVADLDRRRHPFHVAAENWQRDRNLGAIVRNANAFMAAAVHIVGRRRWNRRGAMMTEVYQHVHHHRTVGELGEWAAERGLSIVGVDNVPQAEPLDARPLPEACMLLFGEEGPGLSEAACDLADRIVSIPQYGSTRSINAACASGIVMYEWCRCHRAVPA